MAKEIEIENEEEIDNLSIMTEEKEEEKNNNSDNDLNNVFEDNKIIDELKYNDCQLLNNIDLILTYETKIQNFFYEKNIKNISLLKKIYEIKYSIKYDSINSSDIYFYGYDNHENFRSIQYFLDNIFEKILNKINIIFYIFGKISIKFLSYQTKFKNNLVLNDLDNEEQIFNFYKNLRINLNFNIFVNYFNEKEKNQQKDHINSIVFNNIPIISSNEFVNNLSFNDEEDILILDPLYLTPDDYAEKFINFYEDNLLLSKISLKKCYKIENLNDDCFYEFNQLLNNINSENKNKNKNKNNTIKSNNKKNKIAVLAIDFIEETLFKKIIDYFNNFSNNNNFDIYFITDIKAKNNYQDNIHFINTSETNLYIDNIQCFIDYLLKNRMLDNYDSFIFIKNDIFNDAESLIELNKISYETFDYISKNNKTCGIINYFEYTYVIDNFMIDEIYNNNIIFINKKIIENIDYNVINYEINDIFDTIFNNDIVFKIKLNKVSKDKLFKNIINEINTKNIDEVNSAKEKIKALINEYSFYYKILQYNLTSLSDIKLANFSKTILDNIEDNKTEINYNNYETKNINFLRGIRQKIYS